MGEAHSRPTTTQRALRTASAVAIGCAVLLVAATAVWIALDRRPAWVMAVSASAREPSRAEAVAGERAALAAVTLRIARERGPAPDLQREAESTEDEGRTFVETRTLVLRSDEEALLLRLYRVLAAPGIARTYPQRALRPPDAAIPILILALILGMATLEPPRFRDERVATQPALAVLIGLVLGLLGATAVLVGPGWPGVLLPVSVAVVFAPAVAWLVRVRGAWTASAALRLPFRAFAVLTAALACAWIARVATL